MKTKKRKNYEKKKHNKMKIKVRKINSNSMKGKNGQK